jgi:metallo-beta-lactamase family protein
LQGILMAVQLSFLGASGTVTGSKYLLTTSGGKLLIDCGLFQGYKALRSRNWEPLPVKAREIDAVVLTHAHLDHSGYTPLLVRNGFRGSIHSTAATRELCKLLLPDSAHLQEEDAKYANRHGFSRHSPALPLYTMADALQTLTHFEVHAYGRSFTPLPGVQVTFTRAGHILGAASVLVQVDGKRIVFSGDIGKPNDLMMQPPEPPPASDYVVVESTYGNRIHPEVDVLTELLPPIKKAIARGGVIVVPVFAVGRAQAILLALAMLKQRGDLPSHLPMYLDSPMATSSTVLYRRFAAEHRMDSVQSAAMCETAMCVRTADQSRALAQRHGPIVILSASGMATGGRVLHHLKNYAPDARNLILLTGYQSPGTRGASLAAGEATVRIHGQDVRVRAEVVQLQGASAHADAVQIEDWLRSMQHTPRRVFVTHGEDTAADAMRQRIERKLGWQVTVPRYLDKVSL